MIEALIRKAPVTLVTVLIIAITAGTVFAQEAEESSGPSGLTTAILLIGIAAVGTIFVINWSQSAPDDDDQ